MGLRRQQNSSKDDNNNKRNKLTNKQTNKHTNEQTTNQNTNNKKTTNLLLWGEKQKVSWRETCPCSRRLFSNCAGTSYCYLSLGSTWQSLQAYQTKTPLRKEHMNSVEMSWIQGLKLFEKWGSIQPLACGQGQVRHFQLVTAAALNPKLNKHRFNDVSISHATIRCTCGLRQQYGSKFTSRPPTAKTFSSCVLQLQKKGDLCPWHLENLHLARKLQTPITRVIWLFGRPLRWDKSRRQIHLNGTP